MASDSAGAIDDIRKGEDTTLVVTQDVDADVDAVWTCLTEPDCFKSWWRDNVEFDARLGGRFAEPWTDPTGRNRVTRAEVTAYHPRQGFVMVWADEDWSFDTVVSVSLTAVPGGTRVMVEHQGWQAAPEAERSSLMLDHQAGWTNHLADLATHAEDHDARRKGH